MIDDDWLRALGRAVLYFSFVESAVVVIISSLVPTAPTYLENALEGKKTAGNVAKDFKTSIGGLPNGLLRQELEQLATSFVVAVGRRNDMIHAIPAYLGEQTHLVRLTRDKFVVWSTIQLLKTAAEFEKFADELNAAHFQIKGQPPVS